jgi:hypothetical protein
LLNWIERHLCLHEPAADRRSWRCPDESRIAAYVDGRLPEAAGRRVVEHLAQCGFCRDQVVFLANPPVQEAPVNVPPAVLFQAKRLMLANVRPAPRMDWRWAAAAPAAACLILLYLTQLQTPEIPRSYAPPAPEIEFSRRVAAPENMQPAATSQPTVRRDSLRAARVSPSAPSLLWPREGESVPPGELHFRWHRFDGALTYELRLVTAEGDLVWSARTSEEEIQSPAELPLHPGEKYFVWVLARLPEGKSAKSPATSFRVRGGD